MTHLVLGRIRKLNRRVQRFTAGILVGLLPLIPSTVTHEWSTDASDIIKSDYGNLGTGAAIPTNFSFHSYSALIPFTFHHFSNTGTPSQYAIAEEPQDFFLEPYNNHTLTQTKKNLEPCLCIALRQVSHAPT